MSFLAKSPPTRQPIKNTTFKGVKIKSLIKAMISRTSSFTGLLRLGKFSSILIVQSRTYKKTPRI